MYIYIYIHIRLTVAAARRIFGKLELPASEEEVAQGFLGAP